MNLVARLHLSVSTMVDGRYTPHVTPLHPNETPFVLIPGFKIGIEQVRTCEMHLKFKGSPF